MITLGRAYWVHNEQGGRVYIPVAQGRKLTHCLTIEADGLHTATLRGRERITEEALSPRQIRGHVRRMKCATKRARKLKQELLS